MHESLGFVLVCACLFLCEILQGAWRLSKRKVLTRQPAAIEAVGACTVLCVDKTGTHCFFSVCLSSSIPDSLLTLVVMSSDRFISALYFVILLLPGTLTMNEMTVVLLGDAEGHVVECSASQRQLLPENVHEVVEYAILSSERDPFDPMEQAIIVLCFSLVSASPCFAFAFRSSRCSRLHAQVALLNGFYHASVFFFLYCQALGVPALLEVDQHIHRDFSLIRAYPLSRQMLSISRVWKPTKGVPNTLIVAAKGAPEAIMDLCHLSDERKAAISQTVQTMSEKGLRLLGVARATFQYSGSLVPTLSELPAQQHDFEFQFLGLVGLKDPVRPGVKESLALAFKAGVRVCMITGLSVHLMSCISAQRVIIFFCFFCTGDYPGTARKIASEIGLPADKVITGSVRIIPVFVYCSFILIFVKSVSSASLSLSPELEMMSDEVLAFEVKHCNIFARTVPEQKQKLVKAFMACGEVVAMTGDGVNDAPALRQAHVGIFLVLFPFLLICPPIHSLPHVFFFRNRNGQAGSSMLLNWDSFT